MLTRCQYEIDDGSYNSCTGFRSGREHRIRSPNKNNRGGKYQCFVGGECRDLGVEHWE
jgi:hypothetical protein